MEIWLARGRLWKAAHGRGHTDLPAVCFCPPCLVFIGLLLQGALFDLEDLVHLAVNFLTLAAPLLAVHHTLGKKLQGLSMAHVLKLDAAYYAGVTGMVGFGSLVGAGPLADWALFAASYGSLVMLEPPLTLALLWLARKAPGSRALQWCLDENWQQHARICPSDGRCGPFCLCDAVWRAVGMYGVF